MTYLGDKKEELLLWRSCFLSLRQLAARPRHTHALTHLRLIHLHHSQIHRHLLSGVWFSFIVYENSRPTIVELTFTPQATTPISHSLLIVPHDPLIHCICIITALKLGFVFLLRQHLLPFFLLISSHLSHAYHFLSCKHTHLQDLSRLFQSHHENSGRVSFRDPCPWRTARILGNGVLHCTSHSL